MTKHLKGRDRQEHRISPVDAVKVGHKILSPIFERHSFAFEWRGARGSGGASAVGSYIHRDRKFEFHYRYSLGMVTYRIGKTELSHEDYMWAVLGSRGGNEYPGFGDDAQQQFRALRHDLENFCGAFLRGSESEFLEIAKRAADRPTGLGALP